MPKIISHRSSCGLTFRNKTADTAEIIMYGAIGSYWGEDSISAKKFSDMLKEMGDVKNINLRINSPGGDVFEGITIYNRLKQHKAKVTVYVDAMAASIASIIMLAGDKIIMGEGSQIMIHKPWTFAAGNSDDLEETIERLDDIEEQLISIYAKKTKLSRVDIKSMLRAETWLDSTDAIEKGFADEKIEEDEEFRVAASLDVPWIKKRPVISASQSVVKKTIADIKSDIEGFLAR